MRVVAGDNPPPAAARLPLIGQPDPVARVLAGDTAEVIDALRAHLAREPDDAAGWLRLGACYERIGHGPEAAEALSRAVALDGEGVLARRVYARVLAQLRRYDEAVFQRLQACRLSPDDARVQRELGVAFYDKGLLDKALVVLRGALDMSPNDPRTHFSLGLVYEAKDDVAAALTEYAAAVALAPHSVIFRRTFADTLASTGEMAEAMVQLEEALKLDSSDTQLAMNLDILRRGMGALYSQRLLGKGEAEVERSALVKRGQFKRRQCGGRMLAYANNWAELWAELDVAGHIYRLALVVTDPARASQQRDEVFRVMVLAHDGRRRAADVATATSLTFLRETLGCPMTRASALYAQLLAERDGVQWGGAQLRIGDEVIAGARRSGLFVARPAAVEGDGG